MSFAHITIGSITLNFYGLMYFLGTVSGFFILKYFFTRNKFDFSNTEISDIIFWSVLGGIIGGRIIYILVYFPSYFIKNPYKIFAVWEGGMSIHGGIVGGVISLFLFCKFKKWNFWKITDVIVIALALGMFFGRIGNFVNYELVGRETDSIFGFDFGDGVKRHPSQLYDATKNLLIFFTLFFIAKKEKKLSPGILSGIFLITISLSRFFVEFFREPDPQIGFLPGQLSMGQYLSFIVFFLGGFLLHKKIHLSKADFPKTTKL